MPEVPVRVPIRPGEKELMIEYSQDSRQKALAAANRFGSNVCKAGLGFDVKGEAHMRVKGNRIQIASITTDNVSFHTEASPTEAFRAGVNYMQLTGNDENGACRGFYIITSASAANNDRRILEGYPVVSTEEAAQAAAEKLVNLEFPDGGYVYDRYPKPYQKLQMGGALPFETFTFVPPELRGHHDPVDCVKVTVQMGAPGWKHGDLALAGWEATGVVTHGQKPTITWPSAEVFGRYLKDRESQRKFLQTDPPPSTQPIASP
jgi:hypothetical protein